MTRTPRHDVAPRSPDEIKHALEEAFWPLRCVVEIFEPSHQIRFRVFHGTLRRPVLTNAGRSLADLERDPGLLERMIRVYRGQLVERRLLRSA